MGLRTPLYAKHVEAGARIVDFGGWDMPLHYGSQIEEHHAVRNHAGAFDVSHMAVVDLCGDRATEFLRHLLGNDIARLKEAGKALYTCALNADGGVFDDLIAYYLEPTRIRLIINAATREKDIAWISGQAGAFSVEVCERAKLAMIAVQGPNARELAAGVVAEERRDAAVAIGPFHGPEAGDPFIARTAYAGEDGREIVMPVGDAESLQQALLDAGVVPCGPAARATFCEGHLAPRSRHEPRRYGYG